MDDLAADVELGAFFDQDTGLLAEVVFADGLGGVAVVEQGAGGELEAADVFGGDGGGADLGIGAAVDGDGFGGAGGGGLGRHFLWVPFVGSCGLPGLKSETLRQAQGRLWGTRRAQGRLSTPRTKTRPWGPRFWGTRPLWDGSRDGVGREWRGRCGRALPETGFAGGRRDGDWSFFRGGHGGALEGWDLVQGVEALVLRAVAAAKEGGEAAGARGRDGFGLAGFGLRGAPGLAFGFALGADFAPVAEAVAPGEGEEPAVFDALFEGPEADGGGKVETGGGEDDSDQPGTLDVDVADEQSGDEPAHYTLDGEDMEPAPVPWQEPKDSREKDEGQEGADPAQQGRAAGAGMHPGPADSGQPDGEEEGGDAERLQQQVAEPGAAEAGPVADGVG